MQIETTDFYLKREKQLLETKNNVYSEINLLFTSLFSPILKLIENENLSEKISYDYSITGINIIVFNFKFHNQITTIMLSKEKEEEVFTIKPQFDLKIDNSSILSESLDILSFLKQSTDLLESNSNTEMLYSDIINKFILFCNLEKQFKENKILTQMSKHKNIILKLENIFPKPKPLSFEEFETSLNLTMGANHIDFYMFDYQEDSITFKLFQSIILNHGQKNHITVIDSKAHHTLKDSQPIFENSLTFKGDRLTPEILLNIVSEKFKSELSSKNTSQELTIKYGEIEEAFSEIIIQDTISKF